MDLNRTALLLSFESRTEEIAQRFGGPPLNVDEVARAYGVAVVTVAPLRNGQDAALFDLPETNQRGMVLNEHATPERRRFSIAHEVAHIVLHLGSPHGDLRKIAARSSTKENEADLFAACLLMPRSWVNRSVAPGVTATTLAALFRVSTPAMRRRLRECGHNLLAQG